MPVIDVAFDGPTIIGGDNGDARLRINHYIFGTADIETGFFVD